VGPRPVEDEDAACPLQRDEARERIAESASVLVFPGVQEVVSVEEVQDRVSHPGSVAKPTAIAGQTLRVCPAKASDGADARPRRAAPPRPRSHSATPPSPRSGSTPPHHRYVARADAA